MSLRLHQFDYANCTIFGTIDYIEYSLSIFNHIPVYLLAKKYQIKGLMQHCAKKFKHEASLNWNREHFEDVLSHAFDSNEGVRASLLPSGDDDDLMKDTVIELAREHLGDLESDLWLLAAFKRYPEFKRRLTQNKSSSFRGSKRRRSS